MITTSIVAWFGQLVGAVALCAAIYFSLPQNKHVPMMYSIVFYVIGSSMLLMNLDPLFNEAVVQRAKLIGTLVVFALELFLIDHARREYGVTYMEILDGDY